VRLLNKPENSSPGPDPKLGDLAWYQSLRASLALNDARRGAGPNAFVEIINTATLPADLAQSSAPVVWRKPGEPGRGAVVCLKSWAAQLGRFAVCSRRSGWRSRTTYEREPKLAPPPSRPTRGWLTNFPASELRPQAGLCRWRGAEYQGGPGLRDERFLRSSPISSCNFQRTGLAPLSRKWWVGRLFFFRLG